MMKRFQFILFVIFFCLLAGCTRKFGTRIDESYVLNEIVKGKTTQAEIENKFGTPHSTRINSDGEVAWIYPDIEMKTLPFYQSYKHKNLRITFVNGVVKNYTLHKDIAPY